MAVKGGGGREFWRVLRERYDASPVFQSLLWQINWFWVVTTLFIYLVRNLDVVFVLGKFLATR